jgi:hypothetical protein
VRNVDGRDRLDDRHYRLDDRYYRLDDGYYRLDDRYYRLDDRYYRLDDRHYWLDDRYHRLDDRHYRLDDRHRRRHRLQRHVELGAVLVQHLSAAELDELQRLEIRQRHLLRDGELAVVVDERLFLRGVGLLARDHLAGQLVRVHARYQRRAFVHRRLDGNLLRR